MKALRIFFWVMAVLYSIGSVYNISTNAFDVYQMLFLVYAWLVIYYVEHKGYKKAKAK